jgi:hypothetical protein
VFSQLPGITIRNVIKKFKLNYCEHLDKYYCVLPLRPTKKEDDFVKIWIDKWVLLELGLEDELVFPLRNSTIQEIDSRNYIIRLHPKHAIFYIEAPSPWVPAFRNTNIYDVISFDNGKLAEVDGDKLKGKYPKDNYKLLHADGREEDTDESGIYHLPTRRLQLL